MPDLTTLEWAFLAAAGFLAGAVNAIAGGGSLLSFPALLAVGYGSVPANVTNMVALLPGYIGGSFAYRRELAGQRRRIVELGITAALGGLAGAVLLEVSPPGVFEAIVPFLILLACALLALQPRMARLLAQRHGGLPAPARHAALGLAAVYGGYFGAGLGIMLLAVLGIFVADELQRLNALKGLLSLIISAVAAVYFALFGPVAWVAALIMAVASLGGGHVGVALARRLSAARLRAAVIVYGVVVAIVLLI